VFDRGQFLSVARAREVMRETNQAAFADASEKARPATAIETKIAETLKTTHIFAFYSSRRRALSGSHR
jgi:hypothetical protein